MTGLVINEITGFGVNRSWHLPENITMEQAHAIAERLKDAGKSIEEIIRLALYEIEHGAPEPYDETVYQRHFMADNVDGTYGEARPHGVGKDPFSLASS